MGQQFGLDSIECFFCWTHAWLFFRQSAETDWYTKTLLTCQVLGVDRQENLLPHGLSASSRGRSVKKGKAEAPRSLEA